jgi:Abortive infection C-terminus
MTTLRDKHLIPTAGTRREFRAFLVGTTLGYIDDVFRGAEITKGTGLPVNGQRRQLVEDYYASVDWSHPRQVAKILRVFEDILATAPEADYAGLTQHLRRDGFEVTDNGNIVPRQSLTLESLSAALRSGVTGLASYELRMMSNIDTDPELAIGTSKELVEAVSNMLLEEAGIPPDKEWTVTQRFKKAATTLDLTVEQVGKDKRSASEIKQVLAGLAQVVGGMAELRNAYGTGHGRSRRPTGIRSRHARLAAGAAVTLARFVLDTRDDRIKDDNESVT